MAETKYMFGGDVTEMMPAAVCLEGDSDDYYQVDAAAVAATAGNYTTGTLSAWIMMADDTSTMSIICFGDKNVVEFIDFRVEAGLLTIACTDAATAQFDTQADGDRLEKHKWYHVAATQRADGTGCHLFINGNEIDVTHDTSTDVDEWFNNCDGIDSGRIGAANIAGDDSVTQEWHGFIGAVRHYSASKTDAEIKAIYDYERRRLFRKDTDRDYDDSNDTTSLVNHWDMTDLVDAGSGADNMTAVGDITLGSGCCEFTSKLWFDGNIPLVADDICICMNETKGIAIHLDAA